MNEKSKTRFGQALTSSQPTTTKFLIEDPVLGWRTFPLGRAMLVYRGGLPLPELAGRTVRVVYAHVSLVDKKMRGLHGLTPSEWKFDGEGRIDEEEKTRRIQMHLDSARGQTAELDSTTPHLAEADVRDICRCLGLPEAGS